MFAIQIITTVFDAFILFFVGAASLGAEEKKYFGMGVFAVATMIMNLFCIWGMV